MSMNHEHPSGMAAEYNHQRQIAANAAKKSGPRRVPRPDFFMR